MGIKVPAETVPKNITFRDIKVNSQNVGVHINHCYQIRFESCLIRGNQIGIWGRNHFNSVSIINCEIRRQHLHGVVIGPNVNQWGNTGIHIAGNIFEEIKGYGILKQVETGSRSSATTSRWSATASACSRRIGAPPSTPTRSCPSTGTAGT